MPKVIIVGGGLVGALNACFFAKRGWDVEIYEFRKDIRKMKEVKGRSINLALSIRGKAALDEVGLKDYIVEQGVPMYARLVHNPDGKFGARLPYGKPGEHIISINRRHLNEVMITKAEECKKVKFYFEHKLIYYDRKNDQLEFMRLSDNKEITVNGADLICACDGAYSAVRRSFMTQPRFNYDQTYIEHGFIELNILPTADDKFAMEPNVFHLWPRGDFTLIALANMDKTFTVTLFAPFDIFTNQLNNPENVLNFFKHNFPDALKLIGPKEVVDRFTVTPPSSLVSIKCAPHHFNDKILLMGDAAHAMVPFYGQGMNAGFEDCLVLSEILDKHNEDLVSALNDYSMTRCKDSHAINDLAMYNYLELRDLVNKFSFKARKSFDAKMHWIFGQRWIPLYSMVTFSRIPYAQAIENRKWQDMMLGRMSKIFDLAGLCAVAIGGSFLYKKYLK